MFARRLTERILEGTALLTQLNQMSENQTNSGFVGDLYGEQFISTMEGPRVTPGIGGHIPGLSLATVLFAAATWFAEMYGVPDVLAGLLIGLALGFLTENPKLHPGLNLCNAYLLRWGIVVLGLQVSLGQIQALGIATFVSLLAVMAVAMIAALVAAKLAGQSGFFGLIVGSATAICGASAALAVYSVIGRERLGANQLSLALLGTIFASSLALSIYPSIATATGLSDLEAGFLMGSAIHDVAQALGAGYSHSPEAGEVATIVKLARVSLLIPLVFLVGIFIGRKPERDAVASGKVQIPWFIGGFLAMVAINTAGIVPDCVRESGLVLSKSLLVVAVIATAMLSNLRAMVGAGWRPFLPILAATSAAFAMSLACALTVV